MRILHFSDAHIDIDTKGVRDPQSGLPVRVTDFLKALDTIVDTAIDEKVDLVIFAGDAYRDRTPVPTFQREWGSRILRLSQARIPTILVVGNHDMSPAQGRATAMHEFNTLQIPYVHVVNKPVLLQPADLDNLPLQVIAIPWVYSSGYLAARQESLDQSQVKLSIEDRLDAFIDQLLDETEPSLPVVLAAHASVAGAVFGAERNLTISDDILLFPSRLTDPRIKYVALGHIHKAQDVNHGQQPPIIYPGSIERVDFGEAKDDKFFVIAEVASGKNTEVSWRKLNGRTFNDLSVELDAEQDILESVRKVSRAAPIAGSITRLTLVYPSAIEKLIDENAVRKLFEDALSFYIVRKPERSTRVRLPKDQTISSLTPIELLETYWKSLGTSSENLRDWLGTASSILQDDTSVAEDIEGGQS